MRTLPAAHAATSRTPSAAVSTTSGTRARWHHSCGARRRRGQVATTLLTSAGLACCGRYYQHNTQLGLLRGQVPELDVWRMDIDQPPPGTTAALSDWFIGEMAGFLARGNSRGSR
eukprot:SAG22_NODE_7454_length_738_cov_0.647887_2_plen_114_part_01